MKIKIGALSGRSIAIALLLVFLPIIIAMKLLYLWGWNFSIPLVYGIPGADEIWQLVATKTLLDTGWVLQNQYLGAPGISEWYGNSGSQTSAIHSVLMLGIGIFVKDAVRVQQYYYMINFSLISVTAYISLRYLNIARLPAVIASLLFAFTPYRLQSMSFAYLSNYFIIPLAILPSIWILQGKLRWDRNDEDSHRTSLRYSAWSLAIVALAAVSDGYYAFFTLLLLGFAIAVRAIGGDLKHPMSRLALPLSCVIAMFIVVLALQWPLYHYRVTHPAEADQDQMKQAIDAEVYSPSLKLLLTPSVNHRIPAVARYARHVVETANFNRRFPYLQGAPVILGALGSISLVIALSLIAVRLIAPAGTQPPHWHAGVMPTNGPPVEILSIIALFILLCTISGGIGSLIALFYPAIRAYERFAIFLSFVLYAIAAAFAGKLIDNRKPVIYRSIISAILVILGLLAFLDQTPHDLLGLSTKAGHVARKERFVAERSFVQSMESELPQASMIYQYPYSQYLTNNRYYGWGQFGQLRLYLHSQRLRWSNGSAKGSPVDNWHERLSHLPLPLLLTEVQAAGFQALVADRLVLPDADYEAIRSEMVRLTGRPPIESDRARLAYWKLPSLPYRLSYDQDYTQVQQMTVFKPFVAGDVALPRLIDRAALGKALDGKTSFPLEFTRERNPEIFIDATVMTRGDGQEKIRPDTDMLGGIYCAQESGDSVSIRSNIQIRIQNKTNFDWTFNEGPWPLRVGAVATNAQGVQMADARVPGSLRIEAGQSSDLTISLFAVLPNLDLRDGSANLRIALLQEGNAWFVRDSNPSCQLKIVP